MKNNKRFFINISLVALAICVGYIDITNAAARVAVRGAPVASTTRRSVSTAVSTVAKAIEKVEPESAVEPELIITNKSSEFDAAITSVMESADDDNSFAEEIRRQRAALAASEATTIANAAQRGAMVTNSNTCDIALRKCMQTKCGNDFTKCATDGDTTFGDKLNACRRDTTCTGEEFRLFTTEIKADRDMNVRVSSYNDIINCGNQYNACIVNECGTTYNKCLGKANADAAIQKCATIAKECTESDSGLASRFGTAIGKLRESAEIEVKADEERMYALRDSMRKACESMGAMFDERTFDCIYTINFFAGENQQTPTASRKRYAGDSFICMQEWFGINATTFKENAFRETRSQTAASSAMLGSGVGSAVGLITSGAINRAIDTQKAKKELKEECKNQPGKEWKNGKCVDVDGTNTTETTTDQTGTTTTAKSEKTHKDGAPCISKNATNAKYKDNKCVATACLVGYKLSDGVCEKKTQEEKEAEKNKVLHRKGMVCTAEYNKANPNNKVALAIYNEAGECVISKSGQKIQDSIAAKKEACEGKDSNGTWKNGACYCETAPYTKYSNGKCHQ